MADVTEEQVLADIQSRRRNGGDCDGGELRRRIADLGDMSLDTKARRLAFSEVFDSLTPSGFQLMPWPNHTTIATDGHQLRIAAVLVDLDTHEQIAAEIVREFNLDDGHVAHRRLRVQDAYRGDGLSYLLFGQAISFYRAIGLQLVHAHAALETGRWHWARVGFELKRASRPAVEEWASLCLLALGLEPLKPGFRVSELALLGTEPHGAQISFEDLHDALQRATASTEPELRQVVTAVERRLQTRPSTYDDPPDWWDAERYRHQASRHGIAYDEAIPVGKVIMLAGPNWHGVFDLTNDGASQVFELQFARRFAQLSSRFGRRPE